MKFTALLNCAADPGELTVDQAQRCMQLHLTCTVENCLVRRQARRTLVTPQRDESLPLLSEVLAAATAIM